MNTAAKLSAYGAALVLVAGGAWAAGTAVGPFPGQAEAHGGEDMTQEDTAHEDTAHEDTAHQDTAHQDTAHQDTAHQDATHGDTHGETAEHPPGGLASSEDGYTLTPASTTLTPGATTRFTFRVTGPGGAPVTAFDVEHEKRLHFVVVRRDTAGYQHLHPDLGTDGTWSVPITVADAGSYRAFADFTPSGAKPLTLGVDLAAPGSFQPVEHPESHVADVGGYRVRLDGDLVPGQSSRLTATVTKDGREVTDLQPYLGASGHLVALRGGDLAYLHVHPAGPGLTFMAEVPSAGTYRLFLDFRHGDVVRTAEFTATTGKGAH